MEIGRGSFAMISAPTSQAEGQPTIKQVIVIRRDLRMRRGKEIAQGAHASMAFLAQRVARMLAAPADGSDATAGLEFWDEARFWLLGHFTKVVLQAPDLETLRRVEAAALERGLEVNVITDRGLTEFGGTPTVTALAIGPNQADAIDAVTGVSGVVPLALY
jgi:peptidyl-tRNA hydrolase, PTH2 family